MYVPRKYLPKFELFFSETGELLFREYGFRRKSSVSSAANSVFWRTEE